MERCTAPGGRCNEKHTEKMCPIKPVESGNRGIDLQIESEYLPYLTLLSTSQEGRKGRSEFHGKEKGGPN